MKLLLLSIFYYFTGKEVVTDELCALAALHEFQELGNKGFHLVPEHVETRSLYNSEKPGIDMVSVLMRKATGPVMERKSFIGKKVSLTHFMALVSFYTP